MKKTALLASLAAALVLGACGGGGGSPGITQPAQPAQSAALEWSKDAAEASLAKDALAGERPMAAGVNALPNGDFEGGTAAWTATQRIIYTDNKAHAGGSYAWFGGYNDAFDRIFQHVELPASATSTTLQFWYRITTSETLGGAYDGLLVSLHDPDTGSNLANLKLFTNLDKTSGWVQSEVFDLGAYNGRTVELRFTGVTDESETSSFLIDDVVLSVTGAVTGTILPGRLADSVITKTVSGYSVRTSDGKVQTFQAGERLHFSDASVALDTAGTAAQVYRLYQAAFDRKPDSGGLGYQIAALEESGLPLSQVSQNFISSPEFARTYGSLNNSQFVSQLYANVLHRAPDAGGLAFHTGNLASGANTRANVLVGFSESQENQAALIGSIQNGMEYTL